MPTSTPPGNAPGNRPATFIAIGALVILVVGATVMMRHRGGASSKPSDAEICARLLQQTEEISEASQTGDAKVFERLFDPAIVFTSEDGTVAGKKDTVEQTTPSAGPKTRIATVTRWVCRPSGDVAATSFVDEITDTTYGTTLTFRFLSTEAWRRDIRDGSDAGWRLLSSETLTVPREPWAVPGHPGARKIFRRDESGHVNGYVSRTSGGDLVLTRSG